MAQGAYSSAVRQLQLSLNHCYGESLVVDSDFGPATAAALRRAQAIEGITVDGIYGPQTRNAIRFTIGNACDKVYQPVTVT
ncbi:peptidoglycan-binding domain-containing protein [Micromonospora sp. LOL_021]|uniref:peptidoglycan-binding domain-containing protein n=1 Tax=Micromonospora sp. LOL_021 TaxID=3345417 RepID=UPI003A895C59